MSRFTTPLSKWHSVDAFDKRTQRLYDFLFYAAKCQNLTFVWWFVYICLHLLYQLTIKLKQMKKQFIPQPNELVTYKNKTAIFKSMNFGGKCVIGIDKGTRVITIKNIDVSELKPLN